MKVQPFELTSDQKEVLEELVKAEEPKSRYKLPGCSHGKEGNKKIMKKLKGLKLAFKNDDGWIAPEYVKEQYKGK